jgi:hypothetical protein
MLIKNVRLLTQGVDVLVQMRAIASSMPPHLYHGRAAEGPHRGFVPHAQAAQQLLKQAPAPPRSYGQPLELVKDTPPRGLPFHNTDKAVNIYSVPPQASTCDKQRAAPRATVWAPPSRTCDI